jgi:hypothetical protein
VTSKGISANLITAGMINAGEISIMSSEGPTFRWDAYGISAYDFVADEDNNITDINTDKFVRFDKFGLYGIDGKEGNSWRASKMEDIEDNANFYLTWKGLKVGGFNIGKIFPANLEEPESVMAFYYNLGSKEITLDNGDTGEEYYPRELLEDEVEGDKVIAEKGSSFVICPKGFEV